MAVSMRLPVIQARVGSKVATVAGRLECLACAGNDHTRARLGVDRAAERKATIYVSAAKDGYRVWSFMTASLNSGLPGGVHCSDHPRSTYIRWRQKTQ